MFDEWAADHRRLPLSDPRRSFTPFFDRPSRDPHPWTEGILSALSRHIQSTSFQIITKHAFEADYSDRFRPSAGDRTDCPYCGDRYTIHHILIDCNHFIEERVTCFDYVSSVHEWFRNHNSGTRLAKFLHLTQALNRPLPPIPDQEPDDPP
jgi:hypothetical protein